MSTEHFKRWSSHLPNNHSPIVTLIQLIAFLIGHQRVLPNDRYLRRHTLNRRQPAYRLTAGINSPVVLQQH